MQIENDKLTDEQRKQLIACLNIERGLTPAEVNFIEDISHQRYALTQKQAAWLGRIYEAKA